MTPPTFFLSSTIYDFADLRSAIKYHLEQFGCRVLASEFNDFSKPLDRHSYDACVQSIGQADYFVLLIGSRVGGWYDEPGRVSITQQEYRVARRLHEQGRLTLIAFVRQEVWNLREDRAALGRLLGTLPMDPALKSRITNHPSKFAEDAEFISGFIAEVARNKETRAAVSGGGPLPTGNWVHLFGTFGQVVDILQGLPNLQRPVEEMAFRRLLRAELAEMLRQTLHPGGNGRAFSPRPVVDAFHATHRFGQSDISRRVSVETARFDRLMAHAFHLLGFQLHPTLTFRAVESPVFLRFDHTIGRYTEEPALAALRRLADELRRFALANTSEAFQVVFDNTPRVRPHRPARLDVDGFGLVAFLHLVDRWCNIIELSAALVRHLQALTKPAARGLRRAAADPLGDCRGDRPHAGRVL